MLTLLCLLVSMSTYACSPEGAWDLLGGFFAPGAERTDETRDIFEGLLVRYTFDESASPVVDDSANGHDGVLNGAAWANDSARGGVLGFDGSGDYVDVGAIAGSLDALSFTLWMKVYSLGPSLDSIFHNDTWVASDIHYMVGNPGEIRFSLNGNVATDFDSAFAFTPGDFDKWVHIATVYDKVAKTVAFYIDGELDVTRNYTTTVAVNLGPAWIGGWAGGARWIDARMDDFRIYGRVLSGAEVETVYRVNR